VITLLVLLVLGLSKGWVLACGVALAIELGSTLVTGWTPVRLTALILAGIGFALTGLVVLAYVLWTCVLVGGEMGSSA
jgi:hypothetical protein